jgi:hypothetical protein
VTRIVFPKTAAVGSTQRVKVTIQNRSNHPETIPDLETLGHLVTLQVLPLGPPCAPEPIVVQRPRSVPVTIPVKGSLTVQFDVTFGCAINPLKGKGHQDYRYLATVNREVLPDGEADEHPEDDVCPHDALATPGHRDPDPDNSIVDKGCGGKKPDGLLGADVKTDVF